MTRAHLLTVLLALGACLVVVGVALLSAAAAWIAAGLLLAALAFLTLAEVSA